MVVHILVDRYRWRVFPGYFVVFWIFLAFTLTTLPRPGFWIGIVGVGEQIVSAGVSVVLTVFDFPAPTWPFSMGLVKRHLVDSSRENPHIPTPGTPRELVIQFWYPATSSSGPRQPYCLRSEMPLRKEHLSLVSTHAATGVPLAGTPRRSPVLIFSPSWTGGRRQNTFQAEELSSHEFVLVGIDHPYGYP